MMRMKAMPTKGNNFQEFEGCLYRVENLKVIGCNHKKMTISHTGFFNS